MGGIRSLDLRCSNRFESGHGWAGSGEWRGKAVARRGGAGFGVIGNGRACRGVVEFGEAWSGKPRRDRVWPGVAWSVVAGSGRL